MFIKIYKHELYISIEQTTHVNHNLTHLSLYLIIFFLNYARLHVISLNIQVYLTYDYEEMNIGNRFI